MLHAARCAWNIAFAPGIRLPGIKVTDCMQQARISLPDCCSSCNLARLLFVCGFFDGKRTKIPYQSGRISRAPERTAPRLRCSAVRLSQHVCTVWRFLFDTEFFSLLFVSFFFFPPQTLDVCFLQPLQLPSTLNFPSSNLSLPTRFNAFRSRARLWSVFVRIVNLLGIRHFVVPQTLTCFVA